ncbi:MAG: hypothetical protein JWR67_1657 [Mucilaginibacter sp.]|nr:hypothetical protein [Mucilaginibacter sp.]
MSKFKTLAFFRYLVLFFLMTYLLGLFTNMFFIPRYTSINSKIYSDFSSNVIRGKATSHTNNILQIIDKSILGNEPLNEFSLISKCFLILFIGFGVFRIKFSLMLQRLYIFYYLQYSYLSFCKLRI